MAAIRQLSANSTVLLVEQNFIMASQLGEYYYMIDDGKIVYQGAMADLIQDPALVQQYLGASIRRPPPSDTGQRGAG